MKTTLLLVEDSRFLSVVNERTLVKAGYSVLTAADGEEALRVARNEVPDLILLDMLLPKLGGPEVLSELKRDPRTSQIPVIVLSSLPQKNEAKLKREGATDYVEKSRLMGETGSALLVDAVEMALRRSRSVFAPQESKD